MLVRTFFGIRGGGVENYLEGWRCFWDELRFFSGWDYFDDVESLELNFL